MRGMPSKMRTWHSSSSRIWQSSAIASQLLCPLTPRCTGHWTVPSHAMSTAIRLIQMSNFRPRP